MILLGHPSVNICSVIVLVQNNLVKADLFLQILSSIKHEYGNDCTFRMRSYKASVASIKMRVRCGSR